MKFIVPLLAAALASGGCDHPCATCAVADGQDLAVTAIEVHAPAGARRDSASGLPIFFPGDSVELAIRVWNRSTPSSAPRQLAVCREEAVSDPLAEVTERCAQSPGPVRLLVPSLEGGATYTAAVRLPVRAPYLPSLEGRVAVAAVLIPGDSAAGRTDNDRLQAAAYFAAAPELAAEITSAPASVRVLEPRAVTVRLRNASGYVATPEQTLQVGVAGGNHPGEFDAGGSLLVAPLAPGESREAVVTTTIPPMAFGRFANDALENGYALITHGGGPDAYVPVVVYPDVDVQCHAGLVTSDSVVVRGSIAPNDCEFFDRGLRGQAWSLDAEAGASYRAVLLSHSGSDAALTAMTWRGTDYDDPAVLAHPSASTGVAQSFRGDTLTFTAAESGRHHVVVTGAGDYSLQISRLNP